MKALDVFSAALAVVSGLILLALIGLTFVDVILRYIFSSPILGAKDLLEMGMVVVISLAFPFTWRIGGHIVVDLIPDYGIKFLTTLRDVVVRLIGIEIFRHLAWNAWIRAGDAKLFNEATNMIEVPFQPFFWILSIAAGFQVLLLVFEVVRLVLGRPIGFTVTWAEANDEAPAAT
jgi:TRAP-type C4-dicarboxylate transport system permease small subunit